MKSNPLHHLARLTLAHPALASLLLLGLTAILAGGIPRVKPEFGYRVLVGEDHPSIRSLDAIIEQFGGGLPVRIAWRCGEGAPCVNVLDEPSLRMADSVVGELLVSEGIAHALGPSNAPLLVPTEHGFAVRRLVENGRIVSDLETLGNHALDDPFWVNKIISPDGRAGLLVVQPVDTRSGTDLRVSHAVNAALAPYREAGFEFHLRGDAVELVVNGTSLAESTARLTPFTVLVIVAVLLALSRSWLQTAAALAAMGIGVAWTVGLMGWLSWPQDAIHEVLLPLILVIGACDAMHLLARHSDLETAGGGGGSESILLAARDVGPACLVTSLTTAAAFLSFGTSALDTFVRFGTVVSFGVMACLVSTFTFLPLAAAYLPLGGQSAESANRSWHRSLDALVNVTRARSGWIVATSLLLAAFFATGWALHLRVDTDWNESLGEHSPVVQATRFLELHFGRSQSVEIALTLPENLSIEQPEALVSIAKLSKNLEAIDGLEKPTSIVDLLSRINDILGEDVSGFNEPVLSAQRNAELLELLNIDDSEVAASWVSLDRSRVRISADTNEQPYSMGLSLLESVEKEIKGTLPSDWGAVVSGEVAMNRDWISDVQRTQFRSFPTAAAVVVVLVGIFFGSARLALAALVPTLLAVVVTLGAMGWLGLGLDVGRAMIAAVLIGIGIDDAIHVLSNYQSQRASGHRPDTSMIRALRETGRAIVTTSLALSLGFLTLMASAWQTIASFGFFVALSIIGALVSTLLVLPALLFFFASDEDGQ